MPSESGRHARSGSTRSALRTLATPGARALVLAALLSLALSASTRLLTSQRAAAPPAAARTLARPADGLLRLPLSARGPVSGALGAAGGAYLVSPNRGGVVASNAAQRLSVIFAPAAVSVASGGAHTSLGLRTVAYGSTRLAVVPAAPRARANRVTYSHPGVTEWYANGPLGLEQGFTVAAPSARESAPTLTVSIAVTGNARPSLDGSARGVVLRRHGRVVLRYTGLSAQDGRGRALRSWMGLARGTLALHVDTRGAHYPVRIDPFVQQGEPLSGSGETGGGEFGVSVAVSADGNTALIGGAHDNGKSLGAGAAWVFTRSGETWSQQGEKLTGAGEVGEGTFGRSVALSADGNTALVGGEWDNGLHGAAWVFTRSGGTWTRQGEKLTVGEQVALGRAVALSGDGNTAVIGGPIANHRAGAAWVFTRSGETWSRQGGPLTGTGEIGEGAFGSSVALSSDGSTALIGAEHDHGVTTEETVTRGVGAAWVFARSGESWTQQGAKLTGGGEVGDGEFGASAALSADGNTALIGGYHDNGKGAAWTFTRSGETWNQQGEKLTGTKKLNGWFGQSVALSADGNTALVGEQFASNGGAWVFTRSGEAWARQGGKRLVSGGTTVALSGDGSTGLVGSPLAGAKAGTASALVSATLNPPEVGRCAKTFKPEGSYAGSNCTVAGGTDVYEWQPGAAKRKFVLSTGTTAATLETVHGRKIICTHATGSGEYPGRSTVGGVRITLAGCELAGQSCASEGAVSGEVRSSALEGTIGVIEAGKTPLTNKLGVDLFPVAHAGPVAEFLCGATEVSVRGSVIASVAADKMLSTTLLQLTALKGRQKPEAFLGGAVDVLEASFAKAPYEQIGLTLKATQTNEEALELNTVV